MSAAKMGKERRRLERQDWIRLESEVYIKRTIFKKEWIPIVPFDFSRYGMGIQTDEIYYLDDEVTLSLTLTKKGAVVSIPFIKGYVRYKEKHHSRFNYGIEFYFDSEEEKFESDEPLQLIELTLRRYEACQDSKVSNLVSDV